MEELRGIIKQHRLAKKMELKNLIGNERLLMPLVEVCLSFLEGVAQETMGKEHDNQSLFNVLIEKELEYLVSISVNSLVKSAYGNSIDSAAKIFKVESTPEARELLCNIKSSEVLNNCAMTLLHNPRFEVEYYRRQKPQNKGD
jgi:hypothetical protein